MAVAPLDFNVLFERAPTLLLVLHADAPKYTVAALSDAFAHATRLQRHEIVGKGLLEVWPAADSLRPQNTAAMESLRASLDRVLYTKRPETMPVLQYDIDDNQRFWAPVNSPVLDREGKVEFVIHCIEDVTTFVSMKRMRELLSRVVDRSPDFIGISDLEGLPVYGNAAALEMIGAFSFREAQQTPVCDYFVPEEREFVRNVVLPAARDSGRWDGELHFRHFRTEERIPVLYSVFRIDDPATGAPTHYATVTRDLRERIRSDEELRRYKQFFETAAIGFGVGLPDGTLGVVNPAFARMHGRTAEELIGCSVASLFAPEEHPALAEARDIVAATGHHYFESAHLRQDGTRFPVAIDLNAVVDTEGRLLYRVASVTDITERKRVEGRDRTLACIDDAVRTLENPDAITESVCRIAGEHLGVNRCAYASVDEDQETFQFARSFNRDVATMDGAFTFSQYGPECGAYMRAGKPWIVEDSETDPRTAAVRDAYRVAEVRSGVALPFSRSGRLVSVIMVNYAHPRAWRTDEIDLLYAVATRCWESQERANVMRELREREARARFLGELTEASVALSRPSEIMAEISRRLGEHLRASRCAYADVEADANRFTIQHDYTAPGIRSTVGSYELSLFGPRAQTRMSGGQTLVVRHVSLELAPAEGAEMFKAIDIEAIVCCPLVKHGRLVAMMALHQVEPRDWTMAEVSLVEEVVERSWAYIERARADRERQRAAREAEEQRILLTAITDNAASALFIMNDQYECVYMNPAAEDLTGYTVADMRGRHLHEVIHHTRPDGRPYPMSECPLYRSTANQRIRGEEVFVHPDGSFYPVSFTASPITKGSAITGTVIEVQDIRARKYAEQALRESEERYRFLAESMPQMVWTATPDGALDYVSGQVADYFGTRREVLLGSGWLGYVYNEDREPVLERWRESLAGADLYEAEFRLQRGSDGAWRWFLVRAVPMRTPDGVVARWVGTCTDIHDRRQSEAALRRANRELEEFAYVAGHDLQEPLRMVNIYTQLLIRELEQYMTENARLHATYVQAGVGRMQQLLQDLLLFSRSVLDDRRDSAHASTADLSVAWSKALATMQNRLEEEPAVITVEPLPKVHGDEAQLAQVFQNLLSNAMKYRKSTERLRVHVGARRDGRNWIVSLSDNGIGFASNYAERVFGLFKRLHKEEYPGTGLGLAICKRIVERFGGHIWAESEPGRGATFYFSLPDASE
jgi:PAS domain S-box-containing protein